jgi:hypothetical protein
MPNMFDGQSPAANDRLAAEDLRIEGDAHKQLIFVRSQTRATTTLIALARS